MRYIIKLIINFFKRLFSKKEEVKIEAAAPPIEPLAKRKSMKVVHTNRKSTPGRHIYYQNIFNSEGERIKTIKHLN